MIFGWIVLFLLSPVKGFSCNYEYSFETTDSGWVGDFYRSSEDAHDGSYAFRSPSGNVSSNTTADSVIFMTGTVVGWFKGVGWNADVDIMLMDTSVEGRNVNFVINPSGTDNPHYRLSSCDTSVGEPTSCPIPNNTWFKATMTVANSGTIFVDATSGGYAMQLYAPDCVCSVKQLVIHAWNEIFFDSLAVIIDRLAPITLRDTSLAFFADVYSSDTQRTKFYNPGCTDVNIDSVVIFPPFHFVDADIGVAMEDSGEIVFAFSPTTSGNFTDTAYIYYDSLAGCPIPIILNGIAPCYTQIDSLWFSEETECNDSNIVEICYILSSTCPDSLFDVSVRMSPDGGATWMSAGDGWFATLTDTAGDLGAVDTGMHCFNWIMNKDTIAEGREWEVSVGMVEFLDTFAIIDSVDIPSGGFGEGIAFWNGYYWIYDANSGYVYKSDCFDTTICHPISAYYIGGWYNCGIDVNDSFIYYGGCVSGGYPRALCRYSIETGTVDTIFGPTTSFMPQGVAVIDDIAYVVSNYGGFSYLIAIELTPPFPVSTLDTIVYSDDSDYGMEGIAYAYGCIWGCNNSGLVVRVALSIPDYVESYPVPNIGVGAEGMAWDGEYLWYQNNETGKIYQILIYDTTASADTAIGPLDSRPPEVHLLCPGDSAVSAGNIIHLEWSVIDTFWNDDPCSLHIYGIGCAYDTTIIVADTFYDWTVPSAATGYDTIWFVVAARDSFCNWGYDSCATKIEPSCSTWIDSVWFSEETECNDSNIVRICYTLSSTCPDSLFDVSVGMSPDSGATWMSAGDGWFATLTDTAGDLGTVDTGTHCFNWIMNEDTTAEQNDWLIRVNVYFTTELTMFWPMFHYDAQNTGRSPYVLCSDESLSVLWSVSTGAPINYSAVSCDSTIYFATSDGVLHAIRYDGTVLWSASTGASTRGGPAILDDGSIILGNSNGTMTCFNPDDGSVLWTWTSTLSVSPCGLRHCPSIGSDGKIHSAGDHGSSCWEGSQICLAQDGTFQWERDIPAGGDACYTSPAIDSDSLSFTTDIGNDPCGALTCYEPDGTILWRWNGYPHTGEVDIGSSPTIDITRNRIYFGTNRSSKGLVAVDYNPSSSAHSMAWFYGTDPRDINSCVSLDWEGNIYIGTNDGGTGISILYSFTPDGTVRWADSLNCGYLSDPVVDSVGHVMVGGSNEYLYVFNTDGDSLTSIHLSGRVNSPILGAGGNIYVGTNDSMFYAVGCNIIAPMDSITEYSFGPLDSRPPDVHLLCPGDSAISVGDVIHLEWNVIDTFWNDDPCSLHIYGIGCAYDTTIIVADTFYDWTVPSAAMGCDTLWFVVAARDSFCNWGYDSCAIPPVCKEAWGMIECAPCGDFTGCFDQIVRFIITDMNSIDIDTMRVYLTLEVFHSDATADTFYLSEPSDSLSFSCSADTVCSRVTLTVSGFEFESGDSVWIMLDSLYDEAGCFTDFSE